MLVFEFRWVQTVSQKRIMVHLNSIFDDDAVAGFFQVTTNTVKEARGYHRRILKIADDVKRSSPTEL
ncbi:hypothetical protein LOC72_14415 [Roseiconus lacunae]|nr:hypothetical protein [Roseiconus lacunae]